MSSRGCFFAAVLALAALAGPAGAASKMYKCVEGGRTIYQQQACAVSAQAEAPASAARPGGALKRGVERGRVGGRGQGQTGFACFIRARHAPMRTIRPGIRIAPQMISSRCCFTHGTLPNR